MYLQSTNYTHTHVVETLMSIIHVHSIIVCSVMYLVFVFVFVSRCVHIMKRQLALINSQPWRGNGTGSRERNRNRNRIVEEKEVRQMYLLHQNIDVYIVHCAYHLVVSSWTFTFHYSLYILHFKSCLYSILLSFFICSVALLLVNRNSMFTLQCNSLYFS